MDRKELMTLLKAAARNEASANFSATEVQEAARKAILKYIGVEDGNLSARELREYRNDIFAIIEEVVDQVLPEKMTDILGRFAEIKSFNRDDQVKFRIEGLGRGRVKAAIVPGARGGIYRARRLETNDLYINTHVETIAYMMTLEELLTGSRSITDVVSTIAEGFTEKIWVEIVKAMRAAYASAPAKNKATATGNAIDLAGLDTVIRTVSAYGSPLIVGFSSLIDQITNKVGFTGASPNTPAQDLIDIRNQGYVGLYKGTPVIKLPNYFVDDANNQWCFKETDIFVLPSDAKPVKIALQGDAYTAEVAQPHGGMEWHLHKMMGSGILFYNNIGIYRQTEMTTDSNGLY